MVGERGETGSIQAGGKEKTEKKTPNFIPPIFSTTIL